LLVAYLYWQQGTAISRLRAELLADSTGALQMRKQIIDLKAKVAAASVTAKQQSAAALGLKSAPLGDATTVHISDIERDHPEFEMLRQKQARRYMLAQFGTALASLNLPTDKLARLKDLLTEKSMSQSDAMAAARSAGLQPGTPDYNQAINAAVGEIDQQIAALIGSSGQAAFKESQSVAQTAAVVARDFQTDFTDSGVPLSPEQSRNLSQLLTDNGSRAYYAAQNVSRNIDPTTWLSPANSLMLAQAADILSPAQLEIFENHMTEENQRTAILNQYNPKQGPVVIVP